MPVKDRLLANEALNLKRFVLILSSISLILYLMMDFMEKMNRLNWLPFGWQYQAAINDKIMTGEVPSITPEAIQKHIPAELRKSEKITYLNFRTMVLSHYNGEFRFWLQAPPGTQIYCQGKPAKIFEQKHRRRIYLNKGFNEIEIRYPSHKGWPEGFQFVLRFYKERSVSGRLPFYYYILPESFLSGALFYFLRFLDWIKPVGFILSCILLILLFSVVLFQKKEIDILRVKKPGFGFLIFEFFGLLMGLMFSLLFMSNSLHVKIPHSYFWVFSLSATVLNLIFSLPKNMPIKIDVKKIWAFSLITVLIFGYLYQIPTKFTIVDKKIGNDFNRHLDMVYHFQQHKETKAENIWWKLYPQTSHAFLSILSDLFHTDPKTMITPFLAIILILTYFLVYLLASYFFPKKGFIIFFLIMILANFKFMMDSLFGMYFFLPVISIFFFLSALFFFFRERMASSSIMFAASLIIYPYFFGIFILTMLVLSLNRLFSSKGKFVPKMIRTALFFFLPFILSMIYMYIYFSMGSEQHQRGFFTYYKFNPFSAMKPINSFLILVGISFLFSQVKKNWNMMVLGFFTIFGFFIYYIAYYFFNIGSSYYLIKNLTYMIYIGIILEIHALDNLYLWLKQSKLLKFIRRSPSQ